MGDNKSSQENQPNDYKVMRCLHTDYDFRGFWGFEGTQIFKLQFDSFATALNNHLFAIRFFLGSFHRSQI